MTRRSTVWIHGAALLALVGSPGEASNGPATGPPPFEVAADAEDSGVAEVLDALLTAGVERIETFFGLPFGRPFTVTLAPDRAAFDRWFPEAWGVAPTQCWMVASGVDAGVVVLSPRVWRTQACEHDPEDPVHLRNLVVHELVHTYQGQVHEHGDFSFPGAEEIAWFLEGLATYVSGQLEEGHMAEAEEALEVGEGPEALASAWSGRYRYGVSGSLVRFVDETWGRDVLRALLSASSQEEILGHLDVEEDELLERWRRSVRRSGDGV
jgi:hypothetical protein